MSKRDRGASLTDLLAEATGETSETPAAGAPVERAPEARRPAERKRGGARGPSPPPGHVRESDGSYVRADGARRVSLQLKMDPDDKRALKVQAAAAGLSPAEYVAALVREDGRR